MNMPLSDISLCVKTFSLQMLCSVDEAPVRLQLATEEMTVRKLEGRENSAIRSPSMNFLQRYGTLFTKVVAKKNVLHKFRDVQIPIVDGISC